MCSLLALVTLPMIAHCVAVSYQRSILAETRVELSPAFISCGLNDIATIAAPVIDKAIYQLNKPNTDIIELDIILNIPRRSNHTDKQNEIKYKNYNDKPKHHINLRNLSNREINPSGFHSNGDEGKNDEQNLRYEFTIGPLEEEDHGNWVLSAYFKDLDDHWTEMFRVITIEIIESVPVTPTRPKLRQGDTFHLSFDYPIKNLQSCELAAPSSTYDRFYERARTDVDRCGYVVSNVTKDDEGAWRIIGVGDIVYEGRTNLQVD